MRGTLSCVLRKFGAIPPLRSWDIKVRSNCTCHRALTSRMRFFALEMRDFRTAVSGAGLAVMMHPLIAQKLQILSLFQRQNLYRIWASEIRCTAFRSNRYSRSKFRYIRIKSRMRMTVLCQRSCNSHLLDFARLSLILFLLLTRFTSTFRCWS